jgi:hypothetical protein
MEWSVCAARGHDIIVATDQLPHPGRGLVKKLNGSWCDGKQADQRWSEDRRPIVGPTVHA